MCCCPPPMAKPRFSRLFPLESTPVVPWCQWQSFGHSNLLNLNPPLLKSWIQAWLKPLFWRSRHVRIDVWPLNLYADAFGMLVCTSTRCRSRILLRAQTLNQGAGSGFCSGAKTRKRKSDPGGFGSSFYPRKSILSLGGWKLHVLMAPGLGSPVRHEGQWDCKPQPREKSKVGQDFRPRCWRCGRLRF